MIDVAIRLENMAEIEQKLDKLNANAANEIKKAATIGNLPNSTAAT